MLWLLIGCMERESFPEGHFDTGLVADDDEGETDAPGDGDLTIDVALSAVDGEISCATAGLTELSFDVDADALTVPCDDRPVWWYDITAGQRTLHGFGQSSTGARYEGWATISIPDDGSASVGITLLCDENGVLDGCGGA